MTALRAGASLAARVTTAPVNNRTARVVLGSVDPAGPLAPRAAVILAAVPGWWRERAQAAGLDGQWLDVMTAVEGPITAEVADLADVPDPTINDLDGYGLGGAYVGALTPTVRSRHGRHYTPQHLAEQLWQMTRRSLGATAKSRMLSGLVRDPACGAGALLLPVVQEQVRALRRVETPLALAGLPAKIEGIDNDPQAVWLANVILAAEMLPLLAALPTRLRRPLPALVRVGDGLAADLSPARAVLMNPPYGRVRLEEADRERFAKIVYGHANLYGLFMGAALDTLEPDGALAALVPTSFMAGRYFTNLRRTLATTTSLRDVAFVASRDDVFAGVLQETCLSVFTRKRALRTKVTRIEDTPRAAGAQQSTKGQDSPPQETLRQTLREAVQEVAQVKTPRKATPWLLPRRSDDAAIAAAANALPLTLAEAGWKASTGPLVWNRRAEDLSTTASTDPATPSAQVIWAADIDGGTLHRDRARDSLRHLALTGASDLKVMVLAGPAILAQRTTAPEQPRRLVVAGLSAADLDRWGGRVVVENHVNVLRPITPPDVSSGTTAETPAMSHEGLLRLLSTTTMDRVMRCVSGSVAVSAYELETLPLPGRDVLAAWEQLSGQELEDAVSRTYRPVTTS
ncbi:N-6 DNA methylase [Kineococcus endophyticus]|uniref:site-specific DNA-methyltransferase (adenine-specific) n=1 Tax=Kineococcus endophyticus TaxID=1181883 RepID=A0ABV3PD09_9ACTN